MTTPSLASTATLIHRIQQGELGARDLLVERCLPLLKRWAHGRLPAYGRDLSETDDMVQVTLMRAMGRIDSFHPERQGAFLAYLRQILLNTIRNELRTQKRRPTTEPLEGELPPSSGSGSRDLVADLDAYEKALGKLGEAQRQAVILRLEFGMTFPEIAEEVDLPSADAARMSVSRALVEIAGALP
ncbi:MAG: sigma-70 family RNA polymerase sigma factor [Acidobacteria bacterium]|nr:sigma-70 family RNA polymerase sigma factor [Acidobacteriota bacterium]